MNDDRAGTWLAGKEGPAAMIMPAQPDARDASYRPENIPGLVFEEVTVRPSARQHGVARPSDAIVAGELHDDGAREEQGFAPGYGEFRSSDAD